MTDKVECDIDGCKRRVKKNGLKQHKAMAHGVRARDERQCPFCGDSFTVASSSAQTYCSRKCAKGMRSSTDNYDANINIITLNCENCGEEFETQERKSFKRKFCSPECYYDSQTKAACAD